MPKYYGGKTPSIKSFGELVASTARFHVPVYQRPYCWKEEQVNQLWEDIKQLTGVDGDKANTFLGTIVFDNGPDDEAGNSHQIIDGQQRISTLFLLSLSVIKRLKYLGCDDQQLKSLLGPLLRPDWVSSGHQPKQIKLCPRSPDRKSFDFFLKEFDDPLIYLVTKSKDFSPQDWRDLDTSTNGNDVREIVKIIDKCLLGRHDGLSSEQEIKNLLELHKSLNDRVLFCVITIHATLDPNEVFERLNNAGIKLTNFDLLRNHMMRQILYAANGELASIEDSERMYARHFKSIENDWYRQHRMRSAALMQKERLKPYLFALARIRAAEYALKNKKEEKQIKGSDFHTLQKYYDLKYFNDDYDKGTDDTRNALVEDAINDLYEYKDIFSALTKEAQQLRINQLHNKSYLSKLTPDQIAKIQTRIRRFSSFKIDNSTRPYLLMLFHSIITKDVNFKKGIELLDVIESFLIRRQICGNINKSVEVFRDLLSVPDKFDKETVLVQIKEDTQDGWVRNQDLYNYIVGADKDSAKGIYTKKSTFKFLIKEYDRLLPGEPTDYSDFEVDHVIPQALATNADEALWEGWDRQEYEMWLHKWANLAPLTSKGNKWKSAKDFAKAKKIFNDGAGNNYSSTAEVFALDEWTPKQVKERAAKIANTVIERWPLPESAATDKDKPENIERIDEDELKGN
jgi:hypothetical protein